MAVVNTFGGAVIGGSTSYTTYLVLLSTVDGSGVTGKIFSDVTGSYVRQGAARAAITMATLASASTAWATGGFIEVDATNCPGLYRFDLPDAVITTGVDQVIVTTKVTGAYGVNLALTVTNEPGLIRRFTASAGAATTMTIPSYAVTTDQLKGYVLYIESGTGAGQTRQITANTNAASPVCTVGAWFTNPDATSVTRLYSGEYAGVDTFADGLLARSTKGGSSPATGNGETVGEGLATKFTDNLAGTLSVKHGDGTAAYTRTITRTAGQSAPTSVV